MERLSPTDRYATLKNRVLALQKLKSDDSLYWNLIDGGVSKVALDSFLSGKRERKAPGALKGDFPDKIRRLIEMGGKVAGGTALRAYMKIGASKDVDIFFNRYATWVQATLDVYNYQDIDVCMYVKTPYEGFDIGMSMISFDESGFSVSPEAKEAIETGVSPIMVKNIVHPISTLGRIAKYANRWNVKFKARDIEKICDEWGVGDSKEAKTAWSFSI